MNKICNKCGTRNLGWNKRHHEKTGKWKLDDHRNKKGEWCIKNNVIERITTPEKKIILCEYCSESNFGLCRGEKDFQAHINAYHPNQEILTNLDYMYQHCKLIGVNLDNWKSDLHYEKYKNQ